MVLLHCCIILTQRTSSQLCYLHRDFSSVLSFLYILTATFPGEPGLDGFIEAKDVRNGGDNWSYET